MLGSRIIDDVNAESGGEVRGMELLPIVTQFGSEKTRTRVKGKFKNIDGVLKSLIGVEFEGYEIHMGQSTEMEMTELDNGKYDGYCKNNVYGSYVHGIFDKCAAQIIKCLCYEKGINMGEISNIDNDALREKEYDRLADMVRENIDMEMIYKILNREV